MSSKVYVKSAGWQQNTWLNNRHVRLKVEICIEQLWTDTIWIWHTVAPSKSFPAVQDMSTPPTLYHDAGISLGTWTYHYNILQYVPNGRCDKQICIYHFICCTSDTKYLQNRTMMIAIRWLFSFLANPPRLLRHMASVYPTDDNKYGNNLK